MTDEWYYASNGQQQGPVTTTALRGLLASGSVKSTDLVWREGMSNWAPAAENRELCPGAPASTGYPVAPAAREPVPVARVERRYDDDEPRDRWTERRPTRRRSPPPGMSTGAKIAIFGGIAAFLLVGFILVVAIVVVVATTATSTSSSSGGGGGGFGGGGGGGGAVTPIVGPGANNLSPAQNNSYNVDLTFQGQNNDRVVFWQANQQVRVTVVTTDWGGGLEPDVDLFILDQAGRAVVMDTRVSKDSHVVFVVPRTGQYIIRVNLCEGNRARCVVRY
jgi:hypothetical protein